MLSLYNGIQATMQPLRRIMYTAEGTINKRKKQPTEWEKIFANDMSDKGLIFKIYKELRQLNISPQKMD